MFSARSAPSKRTQRRWSGRIVKQTLVIPKSMRRRGAPSPPYPPCYSICSLDEYEDEWKKIHLPDDNHFRVIEVNARGGSSADTPSPPHQAGRFRPIPPSLLDDQTPGELENCNLSDVSTGDAPLVRDVCHQLAVHRGSPIREVKPNGSLPPWRSCPAHLNETSFLLAAPPQIGIDVGTGLGV